MIKKLKIQSFKSIKNLELTCRRVNIFIGEPNTGKSNILEALGLFSLPHTGRLKDFVRFDDMSDLFYDHNLTEGPITVKTFPGIGASPARGWGVLELDSVEINFRRNRFVGEIKGAGKKLFGFDVDYDGEGVSNSSVSDTACKFYRFSYPDKFEGFPSTSLLPPRGANLPYILLTNKSLRKLVGEIFANFGFRLVIKPQENKLEIQKEAEGVIIAHPYSVVSDTLQRVVFYTVAMETNRDSILIFEEPEAHAFPFYTKYLGERIAFDESNQYFISTHNPYFLLAVLGKTPEEDVAVFVTYLKDYQTRVKVLSKQELREILDLDMEAFFNLERFLQIEPRKR